MVGKRTKNEITLFSVAWYWQRILPCGVLHYWTTRQLVTTASSLPKCVHFSSMCCYVPDGGTYGYQGKTIIFSKFNDIIWRQFSEDYIETTRQFLLFCTKIWYYTQTFSIRSNKNVEKIAISERGYQRETILFDEILILKVQMCKVKINVVIDVSQRK